MHVIQRTMHAVDSYVAMLPCCPGWHTLISVGLAQCYLTLNLTWNYRDDVLFTTAIDDV